MKVYLIFKYGKSDYQLTKEFPCRVHTDDEMMYQEVINGNEKNFPSDFPIDKMWRVETCWFGFELGKICQTAILYIYD